MALPHLEVIGVDSSGSVRAALEEMYHHGQCPWALWREDRLTRGKRIHPVEGMDPVVLA